MRLFSAKFHSTNRLDGKTAVVTGSNTGIGKCTVEDLYLRGARVIMACRSTDKAEEARKEIEAKCSGKSNLGEIVVVELDLTSMASIRQCSEKLLKENQINLLINNAGVMMCPYSKTKDGFEMQMGTNHLGHFLLTLLLLPRIIKSSPARIVNVSSKAHTFSSTRINLDDLNWEKRQYGATQAYSESKIANILFTKELARRLEAANIQGVTTYSLHPGVIATDLGRHLGSTLIPGADWMYKHMFALFMKSPIQGAQTTLYCAIDDAAGKETGLYYAECESTNSNANANNVEDAKNLWDMSLKLVGLDDYNPFATQN